MYTDLEQETLDIDWFFTNNEDIAFLASSGGRLPQSIAKSSDNNNLLSVFFRSLPEKSAIIINPDLSKIKDMQIDERYLADFIYMAKRGLFSFDKTVLNSFFESHYHLVVKPVSPLKLNQLPLNIKSILLESKYNGKMEVTIDSAMVA